MKKIEKSLLIIIVATVLLIALLSCNVEATDEFSVTASTNLEPNATTKLSISTSGGCAGQFSIKTSNPNVVSLSSTSTFVDGTSMEPEITLTAKSEGTATITVTAVDVLDPSYNEVTGSKNVIITVKAKQTTPSVNEGTTDGNNGGATTTQTVTEPKFTQTSKTVYATGNINLRSSWSTSSSATKVEKGTELTLTGTSTEKVNGYVWYRVTYNGQIKYVAKDLITETKPEEKSNNANLKTLSIEGVELAPTFSKDVTEYSSKLENYAEKEIKVTAQAEDEKATVEVEGNSSIIIGENIITVKVIAEDETTKIYTITLTNEETTLLGLQTLKIKDVKLKNFSTDKYEYEVDFENLDKLEIEAIANKEGATIEILGNEELKEGENTITIIVTSADEKETATYQIKANKLIKMEQSKELNIKSLLICGAIALVLLIIIIVLIIKYVRNGENSNIDYIYNDNLEEKENDSKQIEEEVQEQKKEIVEENDETKEQIKKPKVDDLFADYDDENSKKRGKGKHSK